jgi:hypothetical protein
VDEMELRIETQKQTLCARDESMRKLLEMLQSKGLSVQKIEDNQQEVEHLQTRQLEDDRKIKQLQNTLSQKDPLLCNISNSFLILSSLAHNVCFCVSILSSISSTDFLRINISLVCLSFSRCSISISCCEICELAWTSS